MTDIVKLDVGGTVFKTIKSTLTKFDGFFRTMFETPVPVPRDESGAIFVDRSPKHFDLILNFMRDGDVELPESEKELKEIRREAEYYLLDGLVELCSPKPEVLTKPEVFPRLEFFRSRTDEVEYPAGTGTGAITLKTLGL